MPRTAALADQNVLGEAGGARTKPHLWPVRGWTSAYFKKKLLSAVRDGEREWAHAFFEAEERNEVDLINLFNDAPERPQILGPVACRTLHAASRIADFSSVDRIFSVLNSVHETAFEPWCFVTKSIARSTTDRISRARARVFGRWGKRSRLPDREKPRIAYLSMDFVSHSAGVPLTPLIKAHDRERFDVVVFDLSLDGRFKDELEAVPVGHMNINAARARIAETQSDLLIDTTRNLV